MIRVLFSVLFLFCGLVNALAQGAAPAYPCPQISFGWSQQWWGQSISSASYDSVTQLLYVVFTPPHGVSAFSNVPLTVFNTLSQQQNPSGFYSCCVQPSYHAILLNSQNNCPILFETGAYFWAD